MPAVLGATTTADAEKPPIVKYVSARHRPANGDGFGNCCDPDLNNNRYTNFLNVALFIMRLRSNGHEADFDGNNVVNLLDFGILKAGSPYGPGRQNWNNVSIGGGLARTSLLEKNNTALLCNRLLTNFHHSLASCIAS